MLSKLIKHLKRKQNNYLGQTGSSVTSSKNQFLPTTLTKYLASSTCTATLLLDLFIHLMHTTCQEQKQNIFTYSISRINLI